MCASSASIIDQPFRVRTALTHCARRSRCHRLIYGPAHLPEDDDYFLGRKRKEFDGWVGSGDDSQSIPRIGHDLSKRLHVLQQGRIRVVLTGALHSR